MFAEAFTRHHKSTHLILEAKTIFDNSTPMTSSSTGSSSQKPRVPTDSHHWHHQQEEKENLHTKSYKAKLEQLRSALTRRDQAVRLLDMQRLQVVKDT
jgi:hypothetical protein